MSNWTYGPLNRSHAQYHKSSQLPGAGEVIDSKEESAIAILLDVYNFCVLSSYPYPHI